MQDTLPDGTARAAQLAPSAFTVGRHTEEPVGHAALSEPLVISNQRNAARGNRQRLPLDDAVTARGYRVSRLLMPREPEAVTACSTSRTRLPRHPGGSR